MLWHQSGNSIGNYRYNAYIYKTTTYRPHFHKNFELLYVMDGMCQLTVPTGTYFLEPGQMFLVPPYAVHSFQPVGEAYRLWVGVFSADHISRYAAHHGESLYGPFRCDPEVEAFLHPRLLVASLESNYDIQAGLYLVCQQCLSHAQLLTTLNFERINSITDVISRHLTEDISLRDTARELNYEYHYFSRLFHQLFAMNFREFVNLYKVELACQQLRGSEKDISQIALECGFQTVRSFNRAFKKMLGMTPSQYRTS